MEHDQNLQATITAHAAVLTSRVQQMPTQAAEDVSPVPSQAPRNLTYTFPDGGIVVYATTCEHSILHLGDVPRNGRFGNFCTSIFSRKHYPWKPS